MSFHSRLDVNERERLEIQEEMEDLRMIKPRETKMTEASPADSSNPKMTVGQDPSLEDEESIIAEIEAREREEEEREKAFRQRRQQDQMRKLSSAEDAAEEAEASRRLRVSALDDSAESRHENRHRGQDTKDSAYSDNHEAMETLTLADSTNESNGTNEPKAKAHTHAAEIIRLVEYYFSDENLQRDMFLLGKMKGRKNVPVPIGTVHTFGKMKYYQPFAAVLEALRGSTKLNVVRHQGKWCIQRKEPFIKIKDEHLDLEIEQKKPPKAKPTGFEEYFADGPVTSGEAAENEDLYSLDRPFAERIETALQKFKSKRRFNSSLLNIFDKWMSFGGINTGPKQFSGGLTKQDIEERSAAEIAALTATDYVDVDKYDLSGKGSWVVDFATVAKSFLSDILPMMCNLDSDADVRQCTGLFRNFYNYLLYHNVCPDYKADIDEARLICDLADRELFATRTLLRELPGAFNKACSTLFGGHYRALNTDDMSWDVAKNQGFPKLGLSSKEARQIFSVWIAAFGPMDAVSQNKEDNQKKHFHQAVAKKQSLVGLDITDIQMPSDAVKKLYAQVPGDFKPLGKLFCKNWTAPDFAEDDLPPMQPDYSQPSSYEFFVEEQVLASCSLGMKICADVYTLSGGLTFIDNVFDVRCSFYTILENDLIRKWREPRWIPRGEQLHRDGQRPGAADDSAAEDGADPEILCEAA